MPELVASSFNRVAVTLSDGTSFAGVRGATTGGSKGAIGNSFNGVPQIIKDSGRGTGTFRVRRGFLKFDTSGISTTVSSATITFTSASSSPDLNKMSIVRGTADGSALADFDAITGFNNSATMSGNVTDLAAVPAADFSSNGLNDTITITLNATARGLMETESELIMVLVSHEYDYLLVEPSSNGFYDMGFYGITTGTTSRRPHIDYVAAAAGYGNTVSGVASANIGKVKGVATANIEKIIGT